MGFRRAPIYTVKSGSNLADTRNYIFCEKMEDKTNIQLTIIKKGMRVGRNEKERGREADKIERQINR